ncbi:hypothetical protein AgCh_007434 [Apium graveolens]
MASHNLLKLATILCLLTIFFVSSLSQQTSTTLDNEDEDEEYVLDSPLANTNLRSRFLDNEDEDEEYVLDSPLASTNLRSRFLASKKVIKKGTIAGNVGANVPMDKDVVAELAQMF